MIIYNFFRKFHNQDLHFEHIFGLLGMCCNSQMRMSENNHCDYFLTIYIFHLSRYVYVYQQSTDE